MILELFLGNGGTTVGKLSWAQSIYDFFSADSNHMVGTNEFHDSRGTSNETELHGKYFLQSM